MASAFEILGVPARFDLDEADLRQRFIALSTEHHPDRFTDPVEQAEAAERAAAINGAYRLLKDPELRAGELVVVLGGPDRSDDKSLPPDMLTDMLEVREKMEEAIAGDDKAALAELAQWAQGQRREHLGRVGELFKRAAADEGKKAGALRAIRTELNALRYFERMIEQLPG